MNRTVRRVATALVAMLLAACATPRVDVLSGWPGTPLEEEASLVIITVDNDEMSGPPRPGSTRPAYVGPAYASSPAARAAMRSLAREHALTEVTAWPIAVLNMHCAVLRMPAGASREQLLQRLAGDPRVRIAQPMNGFAPRSVTFNDPYAPLQTGFQSIGAADAQQWSRGERVRVAVIDTGLDTRHPDFGGRTIVQRNFVDHDAGRFRRDRHGTAVAGVISASANNGLGIVGVAPQVEVVALKACWEAQQTGGAAHCNSLTLAQALAAAIEERARVVNLSLAGPKDPLLNALVAAGTARGILYIGAAPEDGPADGFPAGSPGVIAVQMSEANGHQRAGALKAPGREVVTLVPGGSYDFVSGPSIATAHVSGVVALLLARRQDLDRNAVYRLLSRSGPQINACLALAELNGTRSAGCRAE